MPEQTGSIGYLAESDRSWSKRIIFKAEPAGLLTVFTEPVRYHKYVIGCDPAEGKEAAGIIDISKAMDSSVAIVLDISTSPWCQVATFEGKIPVEDIVDPLGMLGRWYNDAFIIIESNSTGKVACVNIARPPISYPKDRLYHKDDWNEEKRNMSREIGWRTHSGTRHLLISDLAEAIEDHAVTLVDKRTIAECMKLIITNKRVEAAKGSHDDHCFALGLAIIGGKCYPKAALDPYKMGQLHQQHVWSDRTKTRDSVTGY
jgi:hypothetical protein